MEPALRQLALILAAWELPGRILMRLMGLAAALAVHMVTVLPKMEVTMVVVPAVPLPRGTAGLGGSTSSS